jgi:hypothetical protein
VAREFMDDAQQTAYTLGMPDLAIVELPRGLTNLASAEVLEIARDIRPNVITALTADGRAGGGPGRLPSPTPETMTYEGADQMAAWRQFQVDFTARGFGDGLPLIPPTPEAVEEMLTGTSWHRHDLVAVLEPALGRATVEKIAVNAVMAGCRPEQLPVVLAATEAIAVPSFCLRATAMSTGPHAPLIVVNGPIVHEIGMNSGRGALGPCRESVVNIAIGRALRLVMVNCGYAYLGLFDLDTIGAPRKFSFCLAENEPDSPFPPYHVDRGFAPDESAVTLFSIGSEIDVDDLANSDPEGLLLTYAGSAGSSGAPSTQHAYLELNHATFKLQNLMLVPPEHAQVIAGAGWSKQDAIDYVYRQSFKEARLVLAACKPQAFRPEKLWAAELDPATKIPSMEGPDCLHLVVVGGVAGKGQYLDGICEPPTVGVDRYRPASTEGED